MWLIAGLALFIISHVSLAVAPGIRAQLAQKLGEGPFRGLFSLIVLASVVLIVVGWRAMPPQPLYTPPPWGPAATGPLVLLAFILFAAAQLPSNIKRVLRHPQLTGLAVWGVAHLLSNGEQRSVLLFGGLAVWAVVEILLINRRDGAWERHAPQPWRGELKVLVPAALVYVLLLLAHPWLFGVSPLPPR